jgi:hypothetical protein
MPMQRAHSSVLLVTTCWLVLLASGDDINFARLMLPSPTSALEDVMPLDDPNSDFITAPDTLPSPQQGQSSDGRNMSWTPSEGPSTALDAFPSSTHCPIPLRC